MTDKLKGNLANIISQLQRITVELEKSGDLEATEVKDITEKLNQVNLIDVVNQATAGPSTNGVLEIPKTEEVSISDIQKKFNVRNVRAEVPEHKLGTNIFDKILAIRKAQQAWKSKGTENTTNANDEISSALKANSIVDDNDVQETSLEELTIQESEETKSVDTSNPQAPQIDLSMLTEKQEKAIEGILEKLKVKRSMASEATTYGESYNISVKERRYNFGHSDEAFKASRKTSIAQTDSVGEEIENLSDSGSVIIRQKVSNIEIKPGVVIIEKGYVERTPPPPPAERPTFVNIQPKTIGRTTISMKSLDRPIEDIFSYQGTPISENSPIKTELETILSAQVQRTSREYDSLPRQPIGLDMSEKDTTEDSTETKESSKANSSSSFSSSEEGEHELEDSSAIIEDSEASAPPMDDSPAPSARPLEQPPIPAPRKTKTEFKEVSRNPSGTSLFTMRDWRERDENNKLW